MSLRHSCQQLRRRCRPTHRYRQQNGIKPTPDKTLLHPASRDINAHGRKSERHLGAHYDEKYPPGLMIDKQLAETVDGEQAPPNLPGKEVALPHLGVEIMKDQEQQRRAGGLYQQDGIENARRIEYALL